MRIASVCIKNLRLYGETEQPISFDENKKVTVLLGDNGAGKTTILDACAVLLSQFYEHFPECKKNMFQKEDVRNVSNSQRADYLRANMVLSPTDAAFAEHMPSANNSDRPEISVDMYLKGNDTNAPSSDLKSIKDYSLTIKQRIDENKVVALPIIAYYSTERGQIKPVSRRRSFTDIFPRWDIYKSDSLAKDTDFRRFFTWFERNEDLERREQVHRRDYNYRSPVLEVVRRALNQLFEGYLSNPRVEVSPLRFVMDDISDPNNPIEKRLERMSDGYRITVALVADIASRLAEANPTVECSGLNDPLQGNGVVLIDEIDLHLHPKLQREILRKLTHIFPNVQFIASTHSPSVVIGALDLVQIVKLENGVIESDINTSQYDKYDVSLLLLSDLFEVGNVRTAEFKALEDRELELLSKQELSAQEFDELKSIARQLRMYGYDNGRKIR